MVRNNPILPPLYSGQILNTPLGNLRLAVSSKGLAAVSWIADEFDFHEFLTKRFKLPVVYIPDQISQAGKEINKYLRGSLKKFTIPIDWSLLRPFQRQVLQATYAIPYGKTRCYGEIAADLNCPTAARAVGQAQATNPMPLVIPCHRVIGVNGKLRGYGGGKGLPTKAWLLKLEGVVMT